MRSNEIVKKIAMYSEKKAICCILPPMKSRKCRRVFYFLNLGFFVAIFFFFYSSPGYKAVDIPRGAGITETKSDDNLRSMLRFAADNGDKLNDSTVLVYRKLVDSFYGSDGYNPIWSDKERWLPAGDSLLSFIEGAKNYGLFPSDYHYSSLAFFRRVIREDTIARKNAAIWSRADILLTDAFFTLVRHLKQVRLDYDSVTLRRDSVLPDSFYTRTLATARQFGV